MAGYHFGWVIRVLVKNEDGLLIELADLGNDKTMMVATDTACPVSEGVFRQAGYGPFALFSHEGAEFNECVQKLKDDLLERRPKKGRGDGEENHS